MLLSEIIIEGWAGMKNVKLFGKTIILFSIISFLIGVFHPFSDAVIFEVLIGSIIFCVVGLFMTLYEKDRKTSKKDKLDVGFFISFLFLGAILSNFLNIYLSIVSAFLIVFASRKVLFKKK